MARGKQFAVNSYAYILDYTALQFIERLHAEGYSEFELLIFPGHIWPAELDRRDRLKLAAAIRDKLCHILTLNIPNLDVNIGAADPDIRQHSLQLIEATLQLAADIEASCVLIGPGKPNPLFPMPYDQMLGYLFSGLDRILPRARSLGVGLALENLPISFLPTAGAMTEALDHYGDENLEIVYDVANGFFVGEDPSVALRAVNRRLRLIHVSDTTRESYKHDPVGKGDVPFPSIANTLREIQSSVPTVLEIISRDPDEDIQQSAKRLLTLGWPLDVD